MLSRHKNESIVIGHEITITVVDIRGEKVRIGIDAPSHVAVHRQEVEDAIQRHSQQATMKALETTDLAAPAEGDEGDA